MSFIVVEIVTSECRRRTHERKDGRFLPVHSTVTYNTPGLSADILPHMHELYRPRCFGRNKH